MFKWEKCSEIDRHTQKKKIFQTQQLKLENWIPNQTFLHDLIVLLNKLCILFIRFVWIVCIYNVSESIFATKRQRNKKSDQFKVGVQPRSEQQIIAIHYFD